VSVARDGTKVFVTGGSFRNGGESSGMATVAYRASDGARLWAARLNSPFGNTGARAIVSPGGNRVFVTGQVQSKTANAQYGTVAYNATTGARLWARRYAGSGATSIAVSPDLAKVYVTGESHFNYGTVAYSARTGARLWARFYGGHRSDDRAYSVAVSPGGTVLVTGSSRGFAAGLNADYATVAYSPGRCPAVGPAVRRPRRRHSACGGRSGQREGVRHGDQLGRERHPERLRHRGLQRPHRGPAVGQAVQRPGAAAGSRRRRRHGAGRARRQGIRHRRQHRDHFR